MTHSRSAWLAPLVLLSAAACSSSTEPASPPAADASPGDASVPSPPPPSADGGVTPDATFPDAAATLDAAPPVDGAGVPPDSGACSPPAPDPLAASRAACTYAAGARVETTLGLTAAWRGSLPLTHLLVVVQENRSFDHYFGKLAASGQPDAEGWPASYSNPDPSGVPIAPSHLASRCLPADPPHQGQAMHDGWDLGKMDGFVKSAAVGGSDGHFALGFYDKSDLPFYYWLANTYALGDRYFGAALGGTWANRDYLYAGTSDGISDTGQAILTKPTLFDALDTAHVQWAVYSDGNPRQDSLGWTASHVGFAGFASLLRVLGDGTMPAVTFADPGPGQDEHPTGNVNGGEGWTRSIYEAAIASPLWPHMAIVFTYDEGGGLADHVPPPTACLASPDQTAFDRRGVRIPAIVISPWARPHYVSHVVHDHTSVLRLIEALHDLPALTGRDANADALLDMFDFGCGPQPAQAGPAAGAGTCN